MDGMRSNPLFRLAALALASAWFGIAAAQQAPLSLQKALEMAKERNGTIRSAYFRMLSAKSESNRAFGAFLPTLSPNYSYDTSTTQSSTGPNRGHFGDVRNNLDLTAEWQLLDNGQRLWNYEASKKSAEAAMYSSMDTLRNVLFSVHQQYLDALRANELLAVQQSQLNRAEVILDQTKTRVKVGDAAQKDILQASADALNARASVLAAENTVATTLAGLKATIGWNQADPLPGLEPMADTELPDVNYTLDQAFADGLANRPDLKASRLDVEAQRYSVRLARANAGINYSLGASVRQAFAQDVFRTSALTLSATIPLYDGARSKESIRIQELALKSQQETLAQNERVARSEIEAAYKTFEQNRLRVLATKAALDASKVNYQAAVDSQKQGAGSLLEVLTAQVSLTTAESNNIEATYDLLISSIQLKLVTGQSVPGEDKTETPKQ